MPLTKAERNALMQSLLGGGLKAADITIRETGDGKAPAVNPNDYLIDHKPTGSYFHLLGPDSYRHWSGNMQSGDDPYMPWTADDWAELLIIARNWAARTEEWASTPDLWALDTAALPEATDNSQFTQPERDDIAQTLDAVEDYVREHFDLLDDQVAAIGQTVKELKEASGRIGRKDWKLVFYGAFVSLGLEHAVSPGVVEAMFRLAVQGLGHIFGAGSPPMITA